MGRHHDDRDATDQHAPADATPDARSGDVLRETLDAQEAHGGSMAPDLVGPTGNQVAEPPAAADHPDSAG